MKYSAICLSVMVLFFMFSGNPAIAHPPSDIMVEYDRDSGILVVEVSHGVNDPSSHYIELISVSVDGQLYYSLEAVKQIESSVAQALFYLPGLSSGSQVEISAECSRFGSRDTSFTIE